MPTAEEVRDLLAPSLMGRLDSYGTELDVTAFEVVERGRSFTAVLDVSVLGERWRVRLPYGAAEMAVFDGRPADDLVAWVAVLIRTHLDEWWATKRTSGRSRKLGERLPADQTHDEHGPGRS
ncbi:hypothetical protein [Streptomyces sp. NPDC048639]|uniref:hypothetical protein n=1 Tax=Streptomyces sp. NPDC048639 TaxID=3365581 RepID=UPI00371B1822